MLKFLTLLREYLNLSSGYTNFFFLLGFGLTLSRNAGFESVTFQLVQNSETHVKLKKKGETGNFARSTHISCKILGNIIRKYNLILKFLYKTKYILFKHFIIITCILNAYIYFGIGTVF